MTIPDPLTTSPAPDTATFRAAEPRDAAQEPIA